jgi:hypothetical protein
MALRSPRLVLPPSVLQPPYNFVESSGRFHDRRARIIVYLKYGLAVILTFVGVKMVIVDFYHVPILASL